VDDNGFKFTIFFVAASGFLATSYSLFATNVITPSLYYLYPICGRSSNVAEVIDLVTLVGAVVGMVSMGHLADRAGRKRLYGGELAILIFATMGVVQAFGGFMIQALGKPDGTYDAAMDIYDWISWWRFMLGFGIGAGVRKLKSHTLSIY
jgi:PHS family inorganic phosphate transporter-like MFS transporter